MIERLKRELPLDPARIYVTGIRNGGMMAYRLATESTARSRTALNAPNMVHEKIPVPFPANKFCQFVEPNVSTNERSLAMSNQEVFSAAPPAVSDTVKERLRFWVAEAYRRELRCALNKLHTHLDELAAGTISEFDASHYIHIFNDSTVRDLYSQYGYATRQNTESTAIAVAVYKGVIRAEELEADVSESVAPALTVITRYRPSMQYMVPRMK